VYLLREEREEGVWLIVPERFELKVESVLAEFEDKKRWRVVVRGGLTEEGELEEGDDNDEVGESIPSD
jgi:hypothetical protein